MSKIKKKWLKKSDRALEIFSTVAVLGRVESRFRVTCFGMIFVILVFNFSLPQSNNLRRWIVIGSAICSNLFAEEDKIVGSGAFFNNNCVYSSRKRKAKCIFVKARKTRGNTRIISCSNINPSPRELQKYNIKLRGRAQIYETQNFSLK